MIHATITWTDTAGTFRSNRYSRAHQWFFDGGAVVEASSSPDIVPIPMSDASAVDPEEAFVASLSSCHMLWFLSIAAKDGFEISEYRDEAVGQMQHNNAGKHYIAVVTLRPVAKWIGGREPTSDQIAHMHEQAHQECFIANSVITEIRIEN